MKRAARSLTRWLRSRLGRDDFDWSNYSTNEYMPQLAVEVEPFHTVQLASAHWRIDRGRIVLPASAKNLHPSHRLIYETALALRPDSVFELGFGGGDHLANIHLLLPSAGIGGADISAQQRALALRRNGELLASANLIVGDMTRRDAAAGLEARADLVFTNSVVMHIRHRDRYLTFLRNALRISRRFVLLRERWDVHDYVRDLDQTFGVRPYLLATQAASALLVDKRNAQRLPFAVSDEQIRDLERGSHGA